jgi:hypothetical protein
MCLLGMCNILGATWLIRDATHDIMLYTPAHLPSHSPGNNGRMYSTFLLTCLLFHLNNCAPLQTTPAPLTGKRSMLEGAPLPLGDPSKGGGPVSTAAVNPLGRSLPSYPATVMMGRWWVPVG